MPTLVSPRASEITDDTSVLIFDAPAFRRSASDPWEASIRSYVFDTQKNITGLVSDFDDALKVIGIDTSGKLTTLQERLTLFGSDGQSGENVSITVSGCDDTVTMQATSGSPNNGMMERNATLGSCSSAMETIAGAFDGEVVVAAGDTDKSTFSVFPSESSGWGVISDIDDSIKVTNVLHIGEELEATFLNPPVAVDGMPEVYASLHSAFPDPQFIYVSGSPWQLYPMLRDFIDSTYPAGPIMLQNLTFSNVIDVISTFTGNVEDYKVTQIDKIHSFYPSGKKFLGVGDSTQSDPEVYGDVFRKYGPEFLPCIWIREVDGANNSDVRFTSAFTGVPKNNWRTFTNARELVGIDVVSGSC